MSCVCITLYACQHAFKAREPLPQFIPSTRHALQLLENQIQQHIFQLQEENFNSMGLSLVNTFAEQKVMQSMVDTLEDLLKLTSTLFGTSTWLTYSPYSEPFRNNDYQDHGLYTPRQLEEP